MVDDEKEPNNGDQIQKTDMPEKDNENLGHSKVRKINSKMQKRRNVTLTSSSSTSSSSSSIGDKKRKSKKKKKLTKKAQSFLRQGKVKRVIYQRRCKRISNP